MADSIENSDWIFDYLMAVVKSPSWDAEVMGMIDEHCVFFDNEEENKFIHTDIHNGFIEKVDSLLTAHLDEVCVSPEQFCAACETSRDSRDINSEVFKQIMAMDDFLTFKKLMVKRNMELELEAARELQQQPGKAIIAPENEDEANAMFEMALKESAEMSEREAMEVLEENEDAKVGENLDGSAQTDAEILQEMDASLMEMEILHRREEIEQAELAEAIALSLAMLKLETEMCVESEQELDAGHGEEPSAPAAEDDSSVHAKSVPLEDGKICDDVTDSTAKEGLLQGDDLQIAPEKTCADTPVLTGMPESKEEEKQVEEVKSTKIKPKKKMLGKLQPLTTAGAAPVQLPSIAELQKTMQKKRLETTAMFERNKALVKEQKEKEMEIAKIAGVTAEDQARRRKHLKEQRDKIIAKKKADREAKAKKFDSEREQEMKEMKIEENPLMADSTSPEEDAQRRRELLRIALAKRMKQELLETTLGRNEQMQSDQFSSLDSQLQNVERLRAENRAKERRLESDIRAQKDRRKMNSQVNVAKNT